MRRISICAMVLVSLAAARAAAETIPADKLPEPPVALTSRRPVVNEYLKKLHDHLHDRWTNNFLALVGQKLPLSNPLNVPARAAEMDIVITPDGQIMSLTVAKSSGFPGFDDAVTEVVRDGVPYPLPPPPARSDDDRLHLRWTFARDQRRCSQVAIVYAQETPEIAIPKLLRTGRRDEVAERIGQARAAGAHAEPIMTMMASDWLKQALHEPWTTVRMARVLAERGDRDAVGWLKMALKRPEMTREVGEALAASKVAVCPLVKAQLDSGTWSDQQVAAVAMARGAEPACVPGLVKLLENAKAAPEARAAAAVALAPVDDEAARKALAGMAKNETNPTVRAAAILAGVRPNAGRGKVIAMESILRDPSPEIRAAAAAGVVRAGGDTNLADLYVLFKESDPRPTEAALRELDRLPTEESTKLVARLLKRPQPSVQKLAAEVLVRRRARSSFPALKPYLEPSVDPGLRGLALVAADDAQLAAVADDPQLGLWVYRAYLARGDRDHAADWLVAHAAKLLPSQQGDAMAEWIATGEAPTATATATAADLPKPKR